MPGTLVGGRKAAKTNKIKYGEDFYSRIGAKGGRNGHTGGFASMDIEKVRECGRKGGKISRRGRSKKNLSRFDDEDEDV